MAQVRGDVQPDGDTGVATDQDHSVLSWIRRAAFLRGRSWLFCAVLIILALALNLVYLGRPGIWFDEAFSVELARQPLSLLWRTIFGTEPNMELYYLLLHFWLRATGWLGLAPVEWVVRLPSAICAALSTGVVFLLARRYLGTIGAAVGALLYASNYLQLIYAQQTRAYALQLLLICLSWWALLTAVQSERLQKRWWLLYVVTMVLAIYTHLFSIFILCAQCVALAGLFLVPGAWRPLLRQRSGIFIASLCAIGLLSIPMFVVSLHGSKTGWLFVPHVRELLSLLTIISGSNTRYLLVVGSCILLGLLVVFASQVFKISMRSEGQKQAFSNPLSDKERLQHLVPFAWILVCWFLLPIVISYVVSQGSLRLFSTRYLVVVVPPFCLLAVLGVAIWRWRLVQAVLICALIGSALLVVPHYYQNAQVEDWNSSVHWVLNHYQPTDGLVCYDNATTQGCQIAVEYYLHAYPNGAHFSADTPGAFSWEKFSTAQPQNDPSLALQPATLSAFANKHARLFMITGRIANAQDALQVKATQRWLDQHYHFIDQIITPTVSVRLYVTHAR